MLVCESELHYCGPQPLPSTWFQGRGAHQCHLPCLTVAVSLTAVQYCLSIEHPLYALRRRVRWGAAGLGHELTEQSEWEQKKGPHGIWAPKVTLLIEHNQG